MKINFEHTNLSYNALLWVFKSPEKEASVVKGVPIPLLETVKTILKAVFPNFKFYVKYRGPRQSVGASSGTCRKPDAKSAAIYFFRTYDHTNRSYNPTVYSK